ncbi:MAG: acyl CoA:acetate/3-ketoacid CoA transferase, partial [Chloroflexota bacterium]
SFPIQVGIIRATAVDEDGNCSQDEEAATLDALSIAQAVHNSGGTVICQAKRLVGRGQILPKQVVVPGCLVDLVVPVPDAERQHRQTDRAFFDPAYLSPLAGVETEMETDGVELGPRLVIGRRAIRFLRQGDVVNVGTGIPGDTVGPSLSEAGLVDAITMTVESGVYGGVPAGGVDFGISAAPSAILPHAAQFDFYDGGGLDTTFMGAGQIDRQGNVNVSLLGRRVIGCGGFIDITQSAKRVCFCFLFEGNHPKFVHEVDHLTFSAHQARRTGQEVFYVTERAVFKLGPDGLCLIEVAPGVDARTQVLDRIPFPVAVESPLGDMPRDIFDPAVGSVVLGPKLQGVRT